MTQAGDRRKTSIVSREFQVGLAWRFLFAFLLLFAVGVAMIFLPSVVGVATGERLEDLERFGAELLVLHRRIWPAAAFVAVGMFLYTLWLSRRIAGPVYRINAVLRRLLDGDPPGGVALRRGDYFHETAALLDELVRRRSAGGAGATAAAGDGTAGGRRGGAEGGAGAPGGGESS